LFDLVKEFSDPVIQVVKKNNNWVELKNKKAVFNIVGSAPDEFPAFPHYDTKDFSRVQGEIIADMIEKTIYSVSNDETRYHLNGVYFERLMSDGNTSFRMVATDGHRLSLIDKKVEVPMKDKKNDGVIIPKKGLNELKKMLEND